VTILCEPDPAVAAELAASLAPEGTVRTVPDLAAAALSVEADTGEGVVVIGRDAAIEQIVQFTQYLHAQRPTVAVIVLREVYQPEIVDEALAAGVLEVVPADNPAALADAYRRARSVRHAVPVPPDASPLPDVPPLADVLLGPPVALDSAPVEMSKHAEGEPRHGEAASPSGMIITVFSPKGGSGKTTIATNLAVALSGSGHRVCLIDLDLEFGDVAISLRLTPVRTLVDAVMTDITGDDGDAIQLLVTPYKDGMDCILAPIDPGEAEKIPAGLVTDLVGQLRYRYDYVVIDTPSQFSEHVLAALDASDRHVLITNPELPAMKNLRLTLDMFDLLGYDRRRRSIVFNRADDSAGLTAAEVEEALKSPITVHVPASRDVPASINRGVPIVSAKPDHPVSAAIRAFAKKELVMEPAASSTGTGRRARFLRRRSG
jgi:pilus assembly protein CpaE